MKNKTTSLRFPGSGLLFGFHVSAFKFLFCLLSTVHRPLSTVLILLFTVHCSPFTALAADDWKQFKSTHFVVHYKSDEKYAEKVAEQAEKDCKAISDKLGFVKFDNFWLWEKRVKIFLYGDAAEFQSKTGSPQWAAGKADYINNEISSFAGNDMFIKSILPHELTHLIFRDFMEYKTDVPIWINEGISQWIEPDKKQRAHAAARFLLGRGKLLDIQQIASFDPQKKQNVLTPQEFYFQSASLVGFMIDVYTVDKFRTLCAHIRDGKTVEDALRFTYPDSINTVKKVQEAWRKSLEDKNEKTNAK